MGEGILRIPGGGGDVSPRVVVSTVGSSSTEREMVDVGRLGQVVQGGEICVVSSRGQL